MNLERRMIRASYLRFNSWCPFCAAQARWTVLVCREGWGVTAVFAALGVFLSLSAPWPPWWNLSPVDMKWKRLGRGKRSAFRFEHVIKLSPLRWPLTQSPTKDASFCWDISCNRSAEAIVKIVIWDGWSWRPVPGCMHNSYIYTPKIVRKPRRSETPNRSGVGVALFCRGELNK